jgi:hypothetical protein
MRVYENKVLRNLLHNEELYNLYCLPNIMGIKSQRLSGTYSMHWEDEKCIQNFRWRIVKGRDHLEDLHTDGKIILKCILKKQSIRLWSKFAWHRIGTSGRFLLML